MLHNTTDKKVISSVSKYAYMFHKTRAMYKLDWKREDPVLVNTVALNERVCLTFVSLKLWQNCHYRNFYFAVMHATSS